MRTIFRMLCGLALTAATIPGAASDACATQTFPPRTFRSATVRAGLPGDPTMASASTVTSSFCRESSATVAP